MVETLIEATRAGSAPFQRYARLRKKLLGLETYHLYDSFVPIYRSDKVYPYELARELAMQSVAPLGEDYASRYKRFVSGGRIDVYENEGKKSGAYNAGVYGVGPYLLMNYNDTLDAAFTLAHEAGHAMHTVLSYENQPFVTADYTIFVAEVASTTNERFLLDKLLSQTSDPKERFLLLQHAVDSIVGTFYTQVMFADFELRAHRLVEKGEPVTTEVLNNIYASLLKEYWGDALTVDDFYKFTWARISHFFDTPYYVYQYATCFASSAQLYDAMTTGSPESRKAATERYLTLLKSGGNDHPMTQLKKAGVDLDPAGDGAGGDRADGPAGVADGDRGGEDPLAGLGRGEEPPRLPFRAGAAPVSGAHDARRQGGHRSMAWLSQLMQWNRRYVRRSYVSGSMWLVPLVALMFYAVFHRGVNALGQLAGRARLGLGVGVVPRPVGHRSAGAARDSSSPSTSRSSSSPSARCWWRSRSPAASTRRASSPPRCCATTSSA